MSTRPFGSPLSPQQAVAVAAAALSPPYRVAEAGRRTALRSDDPELPDVTLSVSKERRMFSRSWPLVLESAVEATGPAQAVRLRYRRGRWRRPGALEPEGAGPPPEAAGWVVRFVEAGLLDGAAEITSIQDLTVRWSPDGHAWTLRLVTLAGALIGTAPGSSIVVPFEPEDLTGLLTMLRAFRQAAAGGRR